MYDNDIVIVIVAQPLSVRWRDHVTAAIARLAPTAEMAMARPGGGPRRKATKEKDKGKPDRLVRRDPPQQGPRSTVITGGAVCDNWANAAPPKF